MIQALSHFDTARRSLELASTVDEVKDIRDKAEALRAYMRQQRESLAMQNQCAEISLRAQRRAGEMLASMPKNPGGKSTASTLREVGIGHSQSSRWQSIAAIPEADFEQHIFKTKESDRELTTAGMLKLGKKHKASTSTAPEILIDEDVSTDINDFVGRDFGVVYADPPWNYGNQATRAATDNHYPTMTADEIAALPVGDIAAEASHLHLWTTSAFLREAFDIIDAWGFTFKSDLIWHKPQVGIGNYWRKNHEYLLFAHRGGLQFSDTEAASQARLYSVVTHDRIGHSVKPEIFRKMIEIVSPTPRIELFARRCYPGWAAWGNQIDNGLFGDEAD